MAGRGRPKGFDTKTRNVVIRMTESEYQALKYIADVTKSSMSEVVVDMIVVRESELYTYRKAKGLEDQRKADWGYCLPHFLYIQ